MPSPLTINTQKIKPEVLLLFHSLPPLIGELTESAPCLSEPVNLLLQASPLLGCLTLLLEQPGVLLFFLQDLHHGFLQVVAVLLQHKVLNDERDLVGEPLAGLLEGGIRRVSWKGPGPRPVVAQRSPGFWMRALSVCEVLVVPPAPLQCPESNHEKLLSGLPDFMN